jgi:hypothetical protein
MNENPPKGRTSVAVTASEMGRGVRVTLDTALPADQRITISMDVPLTDLVPMFRMEIAAYESALAVIQGNLELLRKKLPVAPEASS